MDELPSQNAVEIQSYRKKKTGGYPFREREFKGGCSRILMENETCWIELTQNKWAIIDLVDFEKIKNVSWGFDHGYARARINGKLYYLHRMIADDEEIDHVNGNCLDNRRNNIRLCNHNKNLKNQKKPKNNTSGYKGVSFHKQSKKWTANIMSNGQSYHLGLYNTPEDAHTAYCQAAIKYHGEFARFE